MKLKTVSKWLVVIGALNWGLVGLFNLDLVRLIFGSMPAIVTIIYILVGACGAWGAYAMLTKKK